MKFYFKNDTVFTEITTASVLNVFGNLNGYVGSEKTTEFKVVAETGDDIKNLCCRLFVVDNSSGVNVNKYFVPLNSDRSKLTIPGDTNITYEFKNFPDKNGVVFLTQLLNNQLVDELYPYKEFLFNVTVKVEAKTITEILSEKEISANIEFIYN